MALKPPSILYTYPYSGDACVKKRKRVRFLARISTLVMGVVVMVVVVEVAVRPSVNKRACAILTRELPNADFVANSKLATEQERQPLSTTPSRRSSQCRCLRDEGADRSVLFEELGCFRVHLKLSLTTPTSRGWASSQTCPKAPSTLLFDLALMASS